MTIPVWVDDEIWNWSRMHWEGEYPGPRKIEEAPTACMFPTPVGWQDEHHIQTPINYERARAVQSIYEKLCQEERRVIHAEYTRVKEYGNLPEHLRVEKACRKIGITKLYYKLALDDFRKKVWEVFR